MESNNESKGEIAEKISEEMQIDLPSELSDAEMIKHIAFRVEKMLRGDPDLLMSYLYRLDVTQKSIKAAFETSIMPAHVTFANLIWERQKQRIASRKKYKQDPIEGWEF